MLISLQIAVFMLHSFDDCPFQFKLNIYMVYFKPRVIFNILLSPPYSVLQLVAALVCFSMVFQIPSSVLFNLFLEKTILPPLAIK